ncbi:antitoxin (DNA-binding transcriptional repressor) of toxin-antitoxin stability system [Azospirillum fermentarium]|uniref:hypothetical protein n=1 Tax=Azospirillum fermentarium TaxID=1233114 RepID=UPI002227FC90|nr:hypothetical protein [Azospirillum fermentarium]MCW2248191.1 antitoxin (DNA-binding transcriptional repressor) of toxin-antitoxin stability system [Azospirillum fermentarium]
MDVRLLQVRSVTKNVKNSRYARQNFAELLDTATGGERIAIERMGHVAAAVVSPAALLFLESIECAENVDQLLAALSLKEADGRPMVRPDLGASLMIAVRERRGGPRGIMELSRAVPTHRDGKVVLIEFGDDDAIQDGSIHTSTGRDGQTLLHGWLEVTAPDRPLALELTNGQRIDTFERNGNVLSFQRVPVNGDIELEFTKLRY